MAAESRDRWRRCLARCLCCALLLVAAQGHAKAAVLAVPGGGESGAITLGAKPALLGQRALASVIGMQRDAKGDVAYIYYTPAPNEAPGTLVIVQKVGGGTVNIPKTLLGQAVEAVQRGMLLSGEGVWFIGHRLVLAAGDDGLRLVRVRAADVFAKTGPQGGAWSDDMAEVIAVKRVDTKAAGLVQPLHVGGAISDKDGDICFSMQTTIRCIRRADGQPSSPSATPVAGKIDTFLDGVGPGAAALRDKVDFDPAWRKGAYSSNQYDDRPADQGQWSFGEPHFRPDGKAMVLARLDITGLGHSELSWRRVSRQWLLAIEPTPGGATPAEVTIHAGPFTPARPIKDHVPGLSPLYFPSGMYPLQGATTLLWSRQLKTTIAWPIKRWDNHYWRYYRPCFSTQGVPFQQRLGMEGLGLRVFAPSATGGDAGFSGYLSLTRSLLRHYICPFGALVQRCMYGGSLGIRQVLGFGLVVQIPGHADEVPLVLDPAQMDLDLDGLTGAQEASYGTSDLRTDTDGGGTYDRQEVLAGTEPTQADDDPRSVLTAKAPIQYALSGLIRRRLPPTLTIPQAGVGGLDSSPGPLCAQGRCLDAAGRVISRYDHIQKRHGGWEGPSQDGRFYAVDTEAGLWRIYHRQDAASAGPDGLFLSRAEIEASPCHQGVQVTWAPLDDDTTLCVARDEGIVAKFSRGVPGHEVIFDVHVAACEAKMGKCHPAIDSGPAQGWTSLTRSLYCGSTLPGTVVDLKAIDGGIPLPALVGHKEALRPLGWDPARRELLLGVHGALSRWILGLSLQGVAVVRHSQDDLMGRNQPAWHRGEALHVNDLTMPWAIVPTDQGEWVMSMGEHGGAHLLMGPFDATVLAALPGVAAYAPIRIWGDTFIQRQQLVQGVKPIDLTWEFVRYEGGPRAGDVYALLPGSHKIGPPRGRWKQQRQFWSLGRIGPRGGMVGGWSGTVELPDIVAMGVAEDGRMCVVTAARAAKLGRTWGDSPPSVLEFVQQGGAQRGPAGAGASLQVPEGAEAVDCDYGKDGELRLLVAKGEVTAVLRLNRKADKWDVELEETKKADKSGLAARPQDLVRRPDGELEVFYEGADNLRGVAYGPSGERAAVRWSTSAEPRPVVEVDGVEVARLEVPTGVQGWMNIKAPQGKAQIAVRADGRIIIAGRDFGYTEPGFGPSPNESGSYAPYFSRIWLVDPATGDVDAYAGADATGALIALRPGGLAVDPWTGEPAAGASAGGAAGAQLPGTPMTPGGGQSSPGDDGCAARRASARASWPPFALALAAVVALLRRRARSCCP